MRDCLGQVLAQVLAVRATVLLVHQSTALSPVYEGAIFAVRSMHSQANTYAAVVTSAGHHAAERAAGGIGDHAICGDSRGRRMDRRRQPFRDRSQQRRSALPGAHGLQGDEGAHAGHCCCWLLPSLVAYHCALSWTRVRLCAYTTSRCFSACFLRPLRRATP